MKKLFLGLGLINSAMAVGDSVSPSQDQRVQNQSELSVRSLLADAAKFNSAYLYVEAAEQPIYSSENSFRAGFRLQVLLEDTFEGIPANFLKESFSAFFAKMVAVKYSFKYSFVSSKDKLLALGVSNEALVNFQEKDSFNFPFDDIINKYDEISKGLELYQSTINKVSRLSEDLSKEEAITELDNLIKEVASNFESDVNEKKDSVDFLKEFKEALENAKETGFILKNYISFSFYISRFVFKLSQISGLDTFNTLPAEVLNGGAYVALLNLKAKNQAVIHKLNINNFN